MDPEQTFIRVQERFSQMLTLRVRAALEYVYLFTAITLFAILVVMHANFVQQPGCSSELSGVQTREAQLMHIKITGVGLLTQNGSEPNFEVFSSERIVVDKPKEPDAIGDEFNLLSWITSGARRGKLNFMFWKNYDEYLETHTEVTSNGKGAKLAAHDVNIEREEPYETSSMFLKQPVRAVILHFFRKWHRRLSFIWKHGTRLLGTLWVCMWLIFLGSFIACLWWDPSPDPRLAGMPLCIGLPFLFIYCIFVRPFIIFQKKVISVHVFSCLYYQYISINISRLKACYDGNEDL